MKLKVVVSVEAAEQLDHQLGYLAEAGALKAAEGLRLRVLHFLEQHLAFYPKTGRYLSQRDLWETWIPGTKLVIWYRLENDRLFVVSVWHTAQDRN